jgi:hypothetical protein
MHFSRILRPTITQYTLSGTPVQQSSSQKDLGIITTSDLKWDKQVQDISTKANKMLGFVKRTAFDIRQRQFRKVLYLTMFRSQLAYCSQVWAPQTVNNIMSVCLSVCFCLYLYTTCFGIPLLEIELIISVWQFQPCSLFCN